MAVTNTYLVSTKNLSEVLAALRDAQPPKKFTMKFLQDLGFKSTNDRLYISLLKGLGFLNPDGVPTDRYFAYLDRDRSSAELAAGMRDAYEDLFQLNKEANRQPVSWVQQKLRTLTRGEKTDSVLKKMAMTFVALCKHADFATKVFTKIEPAEKQTEPPKEPAAGPTREGETVLPSGERAQKLPDLCYSIHIELPATRDMAVYDAIFRSLKEHIL